MEPIVRVVNIEDLILDSPETNPNKHSKRGKDMLGRSLKRYGAGRSILVDKNNRVIAGNSTVEQAREKGYTKVIVIEGDGTMLVAAKRSDLDLLTDMKARELSVADNRTGEVGLVWNVDALKKISGSLKDYWSEREFTKLIGGPTEDREQPVADRALELMSKWKTAKGQLWEAGGHRILCGDVRIKTDVKKLFAGQPPAHLINTDPPYGVSYNSKATGKIANDEKRDDDLAGFLTESFKAMVEVSAAEAAFYIWHASSTRRDFEHAMDKAGLMEKQYITWVKDTFVLGHADYHWQTEPCFYAEKSGEHAHYYGPRDLSTAWTIGYTTEAGTRVLSIADGLRISDGIGTEIFLSKKTPKARKLRLLRIEPKETVVVTADSEAGDVWTISHDRGENYHPTQKPIALAARAIQNSTLADQVVFDPFLGSGFTALAAEKLGRRCFGMDIDPKWIAVVLERLSKSGLKPALAKA